MQSALNKPHANGPSDAAYVIRKVIWRGWIHSLSWLRRHHLSPN